MQDLVAHMSSNWKAVVEPPPADSPPPPVTEAERLMDLLVEPRRSWTPDQVLEEYETYAPPALEVLAAMQEEPIASAPMTVVDLGTYQNHQLADAFAFDHYCHLRIDLLAPTGAVERDVPPADDLRLVPAVGWMLAGLPQMCSRDLAFVDRSLVLRLTGPGGAVWTIRPPGGDGLLSVVDGAADDAATMTSSGHDFVIWGTKRSDWRDVVAIDGDEERAGRFLDALNIV